MKLLQNFAHTNLASPSGPKVHSNHAVAMLASDQNCLQGHHRSGKTLKTTTAKNR
ncbi:hypothetical protein Mal33_50780 [Rosistilla oblonga]|uniref:Uncharacterized protein n=1 Tax=Rosistilla oblonga TaxID=2527990 RepID=A0A518J135_9BACT|nr:hypothetical protein Mal33_50780 [Rosistilla oblonga]